MNSSGEKKKRHAGLKVLIVIAVLVFLFLCLIGFITDFLWFKELDYVSVFLTKLLTQLKIGIPTFIVVTFLAYVYLKFLKRGYFKKVVSDEVTDHRRLNIISWSLAGDLRGHHYFLRCEETLVPAAAVCQQHGIRQKIHCIT
ncbi:MAG: UPF0182 family protein [Clostridia bacterium]